MDTALEIAGMKLFLSTPFEYEEVREFCPFHVISAEIDKNISIRFCPVRRPIGRDENGKQGERYCLIEQNGKRYLGYRIYNKHCHAWMESDENSVICYYLEDSVKYFPTERQVFYVVCLEHLLNLHHGFILHSSFIRWREKGILFTAPSGTGKSTQADLWKKYEQADILNGDRSALRLVNGVWRAYGLPFAGSSDIYRNESCPVRAIVVLRQAKENKLEQLRGGMAFRLLYQQLTVHPWDEAFVKRLLDDLQSLVEQIPVYRLSCLPDQGAVEVLKQELLKS